MAWRKKLAVVVSLIAVVAVGGAVALTRLIDLDRHRDTIVAHASEALGRDVAIGKLDLSFFPPGIRIENVRVMARPGEGDGALLEIGSARAGMRVGALLHRRVEVTSIVLARPTVTLTRNAEGDWTTADDAGNATAATAGSSPLPYWLGVDRLSIEDGRLILRGDGKEATIDAIDLRVDDVAVDRPLTIALSGTVGQSDGSLSVDGTMGPIDFAAERPLRIDAALELDSVDIAALDRLLDVATGGQSPLPRHASGRLSGKLAATGALAPNLDLQVDMAAIPMASVAALAGEPAAMLDTTRGNLAVQLSLRRDDPAATPSISGSLRVADAQINTPQPTGGTLPVGLSVDTEFVLLPSGRVSLDLERVVVTPGSTPLELRGSVTLEPDAIGTVDIRLARADIPASELTRLARGFASELPVTLETNTPVSIEAHIHGPFGGDKAPAVDGTATLRGVTLRHSAMERPLEQLRADLTFAGQRLDINNLDGRMGSTDLAGKITIANFDAPRITFDLHSTQADLDELVGATDADAGKPFDPSAAPPADGSPQTAPDLDLEGKLTVDRGKLRGVAFADMSAGVKFADGVATLQPMTMTAYGGDFTGRAVYDMRTHPAGFELDGQARSVDIGSYLADAADSSNLFTGKVTGKLTLAGRGTAEEEVMNSLTGGGSFRVDEGRLGKLTVLDTLSKVGGVFGEKTLAALSGKLGTSGTTFDRIDATVQFGAGDMHVNDLTLLSSDFALTGATVVHLIPDQLEGDLEIVFSDELSESMYLDGSRAAEVFRDVRTRRVKMPFKMHGPTAEPEASVDWTTVASRTVQREAVKQIDKRVGGLLGRLGLAPQDEPSDRLESHGDSANLGVTIDEVRWGGSFLIRDLRLRGVAHGPNIDHATLVVRDADGKVAYQVDRLPLDAGRWSAAIEGKKLVTRKYPLTVEVTVVDTAGKRATTSKTVSR